VICRDVASLRLASGADSLDTRRSKLRLYEKLVREADIDEGV
jgi:hypothetical protein